MSTSSHIIIALRALDGPSTNYAWRKVRKQHQTKEFYGAGPEASARQCCVPSFQLSKLRVLRQNKSNGLRPVMLHLVIPQISSAMPSGRSGSARRNP